MLRSPHGSQVRQSSRPPIGLAARIPLLQEQPRAGAPVAPVVPKGKLGDEEAGALNAGEPTARIEGRSLFARYVYGCRRFAAGDRA